MSAITLKDMAKELKLSISTVSKGLSNKMDVSESTRDRIIKLAKAYNYVPNNAAVALRKKRNHTLAIIVPKVNNKICSNLLSEIQTLAYKNGFKLLVLQSFENSKNEEQCLNFINDGSVDGAIIISSTENKKSKQRYGVSLPVININLKDYGTLIKPNKKLGVKAFGQLMSIID
ncbi:LacI family transcriptional regulator [Flavobacteriaceae bacterium MAR_2010_105]|nr:LacI family transcriptional regulator [Flavobacteriaceae bacterium MAR_2010_105]